MVARVGCGFGLGVFALLGASSVLPLMMHQLMFVYSVCIFICFFFFNNSHFFIIIFFIILFILYIYIYFFFTAFVCFC